MDSSTDQTAQSGVNDDLLPFPGSDLALSAIARCKSCVSSSSLLLSYHTAPFLQFTTSPLARFTSLICSLAIMFSLKTLLLSIPLLAGTFLSSSTVSGELITRATDKNCQKYNILFT